MIEVSPGKNPLCFTVLENHAYFYEDKHIRRRLMQRKISDHQQIKREFKESCTPDFSEWTPYRELMPGHYWTFDYRIDDIRQDLLCKNKHPKCILKDEARIKTLIYTFTKSEKEEGQCIIHSVPPECHEIIQWLKNLDLGIPYRGEGLANITYKVFSHLVNKKERIYLTGEEKHELLQQEDYKCSSCGSIANLEWDHITRLSTSFGEQKFFNVFVQNATPRKLWMKAKNMEILCKAILINMSGTIMS